MGYQNCQPPPRPYVGVKFAKSITFLDYLGFEDGFYFQCIQGPAASFCCCVNCLILGKLSDLPQSIVKNLEAIGYKCLYSLKAIGLKNFPECFG